jgi:hypothetical protein
LRSCSSGTPSLMNLRNNTEAGFTCHRSHGRTADAQIIAMERRRRTLPRANARHASCAMPACLRGRQHPARFVYTPASVANGGRLPSLPTNVYYNACRDQALDRYELTACAAPASAQRRLRGSARQPPPLARPGLAMLSGWVNRLQPYLHSQRCDVTPSPG